MKLKILICLFVIVSGMAYGTTRYVGGDISLLPEYENAGAIYKDSNGQPIGELLPYLRQEGMNAMRVRLFVDPEEFDGNDPNACQSLPYILPLCKRIISSGYDLMLDFHYSDTWADPGAQWIPKAWEDLDDAALIEKIYEYTHNTLLTLKAEGITPTWIQTGNEISYGMLWSPYGAPESEQKKTFMGSDANWQRLGELLRSAGKACREVCPQAKIVIHTERAAQVDVLNNFYTRMATLGVDYDIIGLSYYPYFHGNMQVLERALTSLEKAFPEKDIMIVETGFPYKWEVPGTSEKVDYEYSEAGQDAFAHDLVDTLLRHESVIGLFWWWLEYNAYGTNLSNWYNAPLFDSLTGMATPALKTICSFGNSSGAIDRITTDHPDKESIYDLQGHKLSKGNQRGIIIVNGRKLLNSTTLDPSR